MSEAMQQSRLWQSVSDTAAERTAVALFFVSVVCITIALFGETLLGLHVAVAACFSLALYGVLRLRRARLVTGFAFDDEARKLRLQRGRTISYTTIHGFRLQLFRDRVCLYVSTGALHLRRRLLCAARSGAADELAQELQERSFRVRVTRLPCRQRTAEALPLVVMPLLVLVLVYLTFDLYKRFPYLAVPLQHHAVAAPEAWAAAELYRWNDIAFFLPSQLRLYARDANSMKFQDTAGSLRLVLHFNAKEDLLPRRPLLQRMANLFGIGSDYDSILFALQSRVGLVPIVIKSSLLRKYDPETVQSYFMVSGPVEGVLLRGYERAQDQGIAKSPQQINELLLFHAKKQRVVRAYVSSDDRIPLGFMDTLVAGIR